MSFAIQEFRLEFGLLRAGVACSRHSSQPLRSLKHRMRRPYPVKAGRRRLAPGVRVLELGRQPAVQSAVQNQSLGYNDNLLLLPNGAAPPANAQRGDAYSTTTFGLFSRFPLGANTFSSRTAPTVCRATSTTRG